ncbi:aspartate aminotransferase family protein [Croceiramulus getboli]|nr:aminotransferase class III-fold pyridoxal phosphate-dependent enzyme [Flavobacteriaceae bacterium YJPT1-3]
MSLFQVYPLYDVTPERAEDVFVYDDQGTQYLDLYGGHAVISIGHCHPHFTEQLKKQLENLPFYSNAVKNPVQELLSRKLTQQSACPEYQLFLCSSGAEANENALKLASFHTGRSQVIAFHNSFHGRTSAAVAATDNKAIIAPINAQQEVAFLPLGDLERLEKELVRQKACAVILEFIQGVGGLDESSAEFYKGVARLCKKYGSCLIADEVQAGFGRTGDFFAFQKYDIKPDIISMAKGMGNGFPVGGILIHPDIKASHGLLGTTFGGNHLACTASLAVLHVLEDQQLLPHALEMEDYFRAKAAHVPEIKKIKGRGLMLGLEFEFEVGELRKKLIYDKHIFTGGAKNKKLLRILPPLTLQQEHIDFFFKALRESLNHLPQGS